MTPQNRGDGGGRETEIFKNLCFRAVPPEVIAFTYPAEVMEAFGNIVSGECRIRKIIPIDHLNY